jgi:thioredoxin-dependent peroxiredoxin
MAQKTTGSKSKAELRQVFVQGMPATLVGRELRVGMQAPPFELVTFEQGIVSTFTKQDVLDIGKPCLLCCMTSVDTKVGTVQARKFERHLSMFDRAVVGVLVTSDLPFTLNRFVQHEVIEHMIPASDDRAGTFGKQFGILLAEHAVLTRAVFVVDQNGVVQHAQVVSEFTDEPDYGGAIEMLSELV